ncbi:MAG: class I SAM-dependent methyltransferase, partial [Phycisphaeraceae bacterium]|nr:class I SAM-dependent methyltransferase [Phycisphaeraceae bacterium]
QLLEVGVGTGLSLPHLPRNIEVTGIDLSAKMLEKARERVRREKRTNVHLLKMDATHMDLPDDSFDRVLAAYFISTVPEPIKVIEEMKRVCKPGGYLVFLNHFRYEYFPLSLLAKAAPLFYRIGFRTDLSAHGLMESAGLKIDRIEPVSLLGHWKAVRCVNE